MTPASIAACEFDAWRCTVPLDAATHRAICRRMALDAHKWDGQVGDVTTLAPFSIVLPARVWRGLARQAEAMAAELARAEAELSTRPDLWPRLGLPRRVCTALQRDEPWTPCAARVIRFDFHPTDDGWRISEANSDVPGGYTEAGAFTREMATQAPGARSAGDPAAVLCDALAARASEHQRVALLAAPGYVEDLQVTAHLGAQLRARGVRTCCFAPEQLQWRDGIAHVGAGETARPVDAIFRFYQGEWMTRLRGEDWRFLFRGGRTAVCNPAAAVLVESKRFPALSDELQTTLPTWRELLPPTQPVGAACLRRSGDWVLKRSYSNTGDEVIARTWSRRRDYAWTFAHSLIAPSQWSAQARFDTLALATPLGPLHPCLGVYTVDGRACGLYGRLSRTGLIDFKAIDTAILIAPDTSTDATR